MAGTVEQFIHDTLSRHKMHFTLFDPDSISPGEACDIAAAAVEAGTDAILIGGSTNAAGPHLDALVQAIKKAVKVPVILFPGGASAVSPYADAILYMSILNSRNPYFITKSQALGAFPVKAAKLEPIPMAYLIIEPGMTVGYIGEADLLPRKKPAITAAYALGGQFMGMRLVYLEAGSGADEPVPAKTVAMTKAAVDVPVIVGGGIRTPEQAKAAVAAGADIVVTGTIVEEDSSALASIITAVKG